MEIVFLEKGSLGNDLDLSYFSELGHVTFYELTKPEEVPERIRDADVIIVNKFPMNEATLSGASHLKLVALTATGMNNIDFDYTNSHGIQVKNVAGYSTNAVPQPTQTEVSFAVKIVQGERSTKLVPCIPGPSLSERNIQVSQRYEKTFT